MQSWVELPLTKGKVAKIDRQDMLIVGGRSWHAKQTRGLWYAQATRRVAGCLRSDLMHRWIMQPPPGTVVDHINHDGLDNRRSNLRICTVAQNTANRKRARLSTSRGEYVGVCQTIDQRPGRRSFGRWRADCQHRYIGMFDTAEEAAHAYDAVAREAFGEFAVLNFPLAALGDSDA